MIWSVDQDDSKFSALEGLIGRSLTDFDDELAKSQVTDTGYWASQNGQKCKITDCHKDADLRCDDGFALAPGGKKFKDNCGGAGNRQVCCPVDSMPTSCVSDAPPWWDHLTVCSNGEVEKLEGRVTVSVTRAK